MLERMQILIDTKTRRLITQKAVNERKSVSKVIRESLRKDTKNIKLEDGSVAALARFIANPVKGKGGNEYDKYIYDL